MRKKRARSITKVSANKTMLAAIGSFLFREICRWLFSHFARSVCEH